MLKNSLTHFNRLRFRFPSEYGRLAAYCVSATAVATISWQQSHCDAFKARRSLKPISVDDYVKKELKEKVVEKIPTTRAQRLAEKVISFLKYCHRIFEYCIYGAPLVVLAPTAYAVGGPAEEWIWRYVIWAIERLGPTFVKFAQWMSTRPDLYPPKLIEHLIELQDNVTVRHPMSVVEETLRKAFGDDWKNYIELDPKPLGAGCIAQVFKGLLTQSDGKGGKTVTPVAVKLIHPHVEDKIKVDMELLGFIADLMDRNQTLELLSFGDTARQFAKMMRDQLDLRKEAHNLQRFAKNFVQDKWASFPRPIDGFINKYALVETLMEGTPMNYFMNLSDEFKKLKLKLADLECRAVLKMIFFDNFVHGDLHPGNIFVQIDAEGKDPRLIFLDCGLVFSSKSEEEHKRLIDICLAFMMHDGIKAGQLMINNSQYNFKPGAKPRIVGDAEGFCNSLQQMVYDTEQQRLFEHFGEYVTRVCDLARTYNIKLDPNYFHVAMALKVTEGVALSLNRELELISQGVPVILKAQALRKLGISKFPLPDKEED